MHGRNRGMASNMTSVAPTVATSEQHRGRGLATKLLALAVEDMQSRGISVSFLHASLPGPRALYAKPENGYVSMGMPKIKACALVL
jgi:predicted acetyltransferase